MDQAHRSSDVLLEEESTVTDNNQTTVPSAIRHALGVGKRDKLLYRLTRDGRVELARKETAEEADPVIGSFLAFLASDMGRAPASLRPVSAEWVHELAELTAGVQVDLDRPLSSDEE